MTSYKELCYWNTNVDTYGSGFWIKEHHQHRFWQGIIALPLFGSIVWGSAIYLTLKFFNLIKSFPIRW